jgi:protein TonB
VFEIDLIAPIDAPPLPSVKAESPELSKKKSPRPDHKPLRIPENKLPPDTMHGEDSISTPPAGKAKSSGSSGMSDKGDSQSTRDAPLSAIPDDSSSSMLTRLFDKDIMDNIARNASPPEKKGLTFDVGEFKHRGYMRMLRQKIEGIWVYPPEAARLGISGDLYIDFVIKKDGKLGKIEVVRTSGFRELDKAAIKALKDGEPFWPLPEDWDKDHLEIKGHFLYILGNTLVL